MERLSSSSIVYVVAAVVGVLVGSFLSIASSGTLVLADAASNHAYSLIADYMTLHTVRPDLADKVVPFTSIGGIITACGESTVPISEAKSPMRGTSTSDFRSLCSDFMPYAKNYCASNDPSKESELSICKNGAMLQSMKNYQTINHLS
jgi:hypothetical protein